MDHDKLLLYLDHRLDEVEAMIRNLVKQRGEIKLFKEQLLTSWR